MILFDSYWTSIWCVVITMTTVGYGDVFAVSPMGRIVSIINALWGAFIISLLVASIGTIFELSEGQKYAVSEITNTKEAANSLRAAIKYFNSNRRYQKKRDKIDASTKNDEEKKEEKDCAVEPVKVYKNMMEKNVEKFRFQRKQNDDFGLTPKRDPQELDIEVIKEQMLDM